MDRNRMSRNRLHKVSASFDLGLQFTVAIVLFLLVMVQIFFSGYPLGLLLDPVAKTYGETWLGSHPAAAVATNEIQNKIWSTVTIKAEKYSCLNKARLLINGQYITDFRNNPVTVRVLDGDTLEIDTSYYKHALTFKIVGVSMDIVYPKVGALFTNDDSKILFRVKRNIKTEVQQDG